MSPTRVTHVITGLEIGGAELILARLLENVDAQQWRPEVISLTGRGILADRIEAAGIAVNALELGRLPGPAGVIRLGRAIAASEPDVLQSWLLHANVLAASISRLRRIAPVCWSMHMTRAEPGTHGHANVALQKLEALLSRFVPAAIVSCSYSTTELMGTSGYAMRRVSTVPNGFDTDEMRPDPAARETIRASLGIGADAPVVVHAARFHPMKDHANLLAAAPAVRARHPDVQFVLCGTDVDPSNPALSREAAKLDGSVHLLGPRSDVTALFQAADLGVLSSASGEAMPLVIGEAMACGVPFVATDCGDAAELIGDTGRVVPVRDPEALANGLSALLDLPAAERAALGAAARERIVDRYSMAGMVAGYESVWERLAARPSRTA